MSKIEHTHNPVFGITYSEVFMSSDRQIAPTKQVHDNNSAVLQISALPPASSSELLPLIKKDDTEPNLASCFIAPSWHLPYAQALIEEAVPFLPISITLAERAILTRYFELHEIAEPLEERRDLWRAVEELRKLRKKLSKT